MRNLRRFWRHVTSLSGAAMLLQTSSCALDDETWNALLSTGLEIALSTLTAV